jgi:predicted RNase H-like HicB family nuclease
LPASVKHIHCGDASPAFIGWKVQFLPQYVDEFRRLAPDVVLDARKPDRRQCYIIGGNNALKIWQVSSKRGKDAMRPKHYSMIIQWSEEDRVYIVTVPELPGCKTHGKTYKKAVKQGEDAIESWIMAAKDRGHPIPAPRILTATSID